MDVAQKMDQEPNLFVDGKGLAADFQALRGLAVSAQRGDQLGDATVWAPVRRRIDSFKQSEVDVVPWFCDSLAPRHVIRPCGDSRHSVREVGCARLGRSGWPEKARQNRIVGPFAQER